MMFKSVFEKTIVCVAANIPLFLFMYNYLNIPTKYLSITLFITLVSFTLVTYVFHQRIHITFKLSLPSKILLPVIYIACLIIVSLLPSISKGIFIQLSSVKMFSWIRVLAGLLLGIFLPGFTILSLFNHKLTPSLLLLSSFLLSIFINALTAFITLVFAQSFLPWIFIINALIIVLSLIKMLRNRGCHLTKHVSIVLDNEHILMFLLLLFQLSLLVSVFLLSRLTVPDGDMWDHASMATRIEKGALTRFGVLTYPPFFPLHLFSVSQLSGLPALSISKVLGLFNLFIILAFYDLALVLTNNRSTAFLSTFIFTTFGSFTFLVQAMLGKMSTDIQSLSQNFFQISWKTMLINSVYTISNIHAYAPAPLHLLSLLVLTSLVIRKDKAWISYMLEIILILNLFLLHIAETVYVLIFLFSALMVGLSDIKDSFFLTLGVWLGVAIISSLPFIKADIPIYIGILYVIVLIFTVLYGRFLRKIFILILSRKIANIALNNFIKIILAFVILFSYGILLSIWKVLYIDKDWYITSLLHNLGVAPTYFMPVAFGLPLLISVVYFSKCLLLRNSLPQKNGKILAFLGMAFVLAYFFGKSITFLNLFGDIVYRELRILSVFGGIIFSIVSGLALHEVCEYFKSLNINWKSVMAVSLGLLILLNSGSTFLSATFWSNIGMEAYPMSSSELQALDFLKQKVNPSNVILTYRDARSTKVGLTGATTLIRYRVPFTSLSPSIPKAYLQIVDYIYLTKQDYNMIQKSDTYMKSILNILPIIFNNSEVLIFEAPQSIKNYNEGPFVPIVINTNLRDSLQKIALLDFLGLSHSIYDEWDFGYFMNNRTIILVDDVKNVSNAKKYIEWIGKGGQLIILATNEGYFSQLMKIHVKKEVNVTFVSGIDGSDLGSKLSIIPKESLDKTVRVKSWYTLDNQRVAPFVFEKEIGEGKILYVDFAPLLKSKPAQYSDPKTFLKSLDQLLLNYIEENNAKEGIKIRRVPPIEIHGEQNLNGNISIYSTSMAFYGSNITSKIKLTNGKEFLIDTNRLVFYSAHNITLSLNASTILRPLHDKYIEVFIPKNTTLRLFPYNKNKEMLIYLPDKNRSYNVSEVIIHSTSNISVIVRAPHITISGIVTFQGAFFDIPYDKIIKNGLGALTLRGNLSYNVLISDKSANRCYGDHFNLIGSYKYHYPTLLEIELPINLIDVFKQNIFYLLLIIIIYALFIAITLLRRQESD